MERIPHDSEAFLDAPALTGSDLASPLTATPSPCNDAPSRTRCFGPFHGVALFAGITAALWCAHGCATGQDRAATPADTAGGATPITISFEVDPIGSPPAGWTMASVGSEGPKATWQVVADPATATPTTTPTTTSAPAPSPARVLSLTAVNHSSTGAYNLCWTDGVQFTNGTIEARVRANAGSEDQGGGVMWRVQDHNNYMVARYNPLEENFRLYFVSEGKRKQLATATIAPAIPTGVWFTIRVEHTANAIVCSLNGTKELEATDDHIRRGGGVGVWTKADAATSFDDIVVCPVSSATR